MAERTAIAWCDHTWSPWRGCTKVSAGCTHCYAETLSHRNPVVLGTWGPKGARPINADWGLPLRWDRAARKAGVRRRVFPSLCDPFEDRDDLLSTRTRFFDMIDQTPHLDWLVLTKRPESIAALMPNGMGVISPAFNLRRNLWLGVSVEDQGNADRRIPELLEIPAAVRWLSCEPLLGPIRLKALWHWGIDWVVIGGESGPYYRPCRVEWIADLVAQCEESSMPCFVKQAAGRFPGRQGDIPHDLWAVKEFPKVPAVQS